MFSQDFVDITENPLKISREEQLSCLLKKRKLQVLFTGLTLLSEPLQVHSQLHSEKCFNKDWSNDLVDKLKCRGLEVLSLVHKL